VDGVQRRDSSTNVPLNVNLSQGLYTASIGVGSPPTTFNLIIDTGSSNTWVGANTAYVVTSTSMKTSDGLNETYGSGFVMGTQYTDSVTIATGLVISAQSIGVASNSSGIFPLDGILGVGPDDLTLGTLIPNNSDVIPTVTDNLFSQGLIGQKLIAVSFEPPTSASVTNGELTFGGTDSTKFTGDITYTPITTSFPSSTFWGVDASFQYGNSSATTILATTAGFVDTGTTLLGLTSDAYNLYLQATGGVSDSTTGHVQITPAQYDSLESLFFEIGGTSFELTPNAQIFPRSLNSLIGGTSDFVYLNVFDMGAPAPETSDFVIGLQALERFYTVFDTTNQRVGFATTPFTNATTN